MARALNPLLFAALLVVVPQSTVTPDPWITEKRRRDSATVRIELAVIGRPISLAQAVILARQIMESAERERLQLAEREALRGIQWD
jgi:hypothetical protein